MASVDRIHELMEDEVSDHLLDQEKKAHIELQQALSSQESFWKEKARVNWHSLGDRNTTYFRKIASIRQKSKQMTVLRKDDGLLEEAFDIENHVIDYFGSLYASANNCVDNDLIDTVILSMVSSTNNCMLTNLPFTDEIKSAVFSMNGSCAPGPDGFGGCFYQAF